MSFILVVTIAQYTAAATLHSCCPSRTVPVAALLLPSPSPELILLYISCVHRCLTFIVIVVVLGLTPLGFQLRHPRLRGLKGFPVDAHQLKKQSHRCYQETRDLRGQW